jgi:hypothetical protein
MASHARERDRQNEEKGRENETRERRNYRGIRVFIEASRTLSTLCIYRIINVKNVNEISNFRLRFVLEA